MILPFTVLRRLDCVLASTKEAALAEFAARTAARLNPRSFLLGVNGRGFFSVSRVDLKRLMGDQNHIAFNLEAYIHGFSPEVHDMLEHDLLEASIALPTDIF